MRILRLVAVSMLVLTAVPRAQFGAPDTDARIAKLVASVSQSRMEQLLRTLVAFGTRNTLSDTSSTTRGIGAARQWILDEMTRSSPKLQVSFDTHQLPKAGRITREVELRNIVAILPGRSPRRIYVSGHYDTVNLGAQGQAGVNTAGGGYNNPAENADAPGADDEGRARKHVRPRPRTRRCRRSSTMTSSADRSAAMESSMARRFVSTRRARRIHPRARWRSSRSASPGATCRRIASG